MLFWCLYLLRIFVPVFAFFFVIFVFAMYLCILLFIVFFFGYLYFSCFACFSIYTIMFLLFVHGSIDKSTDIKIMLNRWAYNYIINFSPAIMKIMGCVFCPPLTAPISIYSAYFSSCSDCNVLTKISAT